MFLFYFLLFSQIFVENIKLVIFVTKVSCDDIIIWTDLMFEPHNGFGFRL
jgi:hypothetical protein